MPGPHHCKKEESFLVLFFKKEQRFFLKKEAKTFYPLERWLLGRVEFGHGDMMDDASRRPIAARRAGWARWTAARLARSSVTPNQISMASVGFAAAGAAAMLWGAGGPAWLLAALCVQARLVCNLLDGMVAIEGGKSTPAGALYNEFPDRIADSFFLIAVGYASGQDWLGWCAALLAALTAYVRVFGASLGQPPDFSGIMAKQRRMAALTAGLVIQAGAVFFTASRWPLLVTAIVIAAGSAVTCVTRSANILKRLA
jgi:CDP-diacylglycerol--glycerol-3-phosphate 3-phosphatidyltransferase